MTQPSRSRQKLYVVQQIGWHSNDEQMIPGELNLLKAFRSRERAEAHRRELESQARADPAQHFASVIEFLFGDGLASVTSLREEQMLAHLQRFGIEPPPKDGPRFRWDHYPWWEEIQGRLEGETLRQFLEAFDRRQYYQVVETEMES